MRRRARRLLLAVGTLAMLVVGSVPVVQAQEESPAPEGEP